MVATPTSLWKWGMPVSAISDAHASWNAGRILSRSGAARLELAAPLRVSHVMERTTPAPLQVRGYSPPVMELRLAWLYLFVAGLFEVGWAIGLKYTDGFSRPVPTLLTVASMVISLGLLGLALKTLPVGTAYAIWTGVGALGTAILGIVLFGEPATALRLACLGLIVGGIVGLKLVA
jgi:quaternary ammonium compound-resistance protein SugE